ncbi:CpaE family protein [Aestuariivirga sp.]|uniref:CpaE family protein n=1 Tax=Aestuariivirga sp. TaxID=2650926 RepID=UPI003782FC4F
MEVQRDATVSADSGSGLVALVPRINIQAFCENSQTAEAMRRAGEDRRMAQAHCQVQMGGIPAAIRLFEMQSSPNLLIVEAAADQGTLLTNLNALASVCQAETKVVVIGQFNDVLLYRELIRQGVSEYLVAPVSQIQLIETISSLYQNTRAAPVGRVVAFMAARGGTGSSTIAHNCAWEASRSADLETVIVDLDLAYGTAGLNFNLDTSLGLLEAIDQPSRIDSVLMDRLLVKIGGKLNLLSGPGGIERDIDIDPEAIEAVFVSLRASFPFIVADLPMLWSRWVKFTLIHADQVIITAEPDLASLRNAKYIIDMLKLARPNDAAPTLLLNRVGVSKRPEISATDFKKALGVDVVATIPNDPQNFGEALNNGKMLLELAPKAKAAEAIRGFARGLVGVTKIAKPESPLSSLVGMIPALRKK